MARPELAVLDPLRELILPRLDRVRQAGKGWTARCPAHEDRNASLSLGIGREGQALVHCFAGCHVGDVLGAIGLELRDLYPREPRDLSPLARAERRDALQAAHTRAAAAHLAEAGLRIELAGCAMLAGEPLSPEDVGTLAQAVAQAREAVQVLEAVR